MEYSERDDTSSAEKSENDYSTEGEDTVSSDTNFQENSTLDL